MTIYRARRELLRLATAIFEATWYYIAWRLAFAFFAPDHAAPSYALVLGLTVLAIYVARYFDLGRPGTNTQSWTVGLTAAVTLFLAAASTGLGGPLTFLVGLRDFHDPNVLLTLGHIILWWRAISVVGEGFGVERTGFRFRLGIVAMFWCLIGVAFVGLDVTAYIFIYFPASLLAMSLARVEEVSRDVVGVATPFDRNWVTILLAAVLSVMLVGVLATSLLSVEAVRTIVGWFAPLWNLLAALLIGIVYIIVLLLNPFIQALVNALRPTLAQLPQIAQGTPTPTPEETMSGPPILPEALLMGLRWVLVVAALAGVFWLLAVWAQRRRDRLAEPVPELRESVWSADAFAQDARALLDRALARLRGQRRSHAADTVRHIYASLQALAADRGVPRPPDDTPYEYLPALVEAFPEAAADLRFLTQAYVDAHYHELPTSDADLSRARVAWQHVQRAALQTPRREPVTE